MPLPALKSPPRVSIVIPAHNEEDKIGSAVKTALAQAYPDFEVIVVDNASDDGTGARAAEAGAHVVREDRKGILFAKEAGRKAATGEILAGLDADCIPPTDWLRRGVVFFEDPHVVAVTGGFDYYDLSPIPRTLIRWGAMFVHRPISYLLQALGRGAYMIGGNCLIRKSALEKIGGYDTNIRFWGEDTDTATRLSSVGKVVYAKNLFVRSSGRRFLRDGYIKPFLTYVGSDVKVFTRHR